MTGAEKAEITQSAEAMYVRIGEIAAIHGQNGQDAIAASRAAVARFVDELASDNPDGKDLVNNLSSLRAPMEGAFQRALTRTGGVRLRR